MSDESGKWLAYNKDKSIHDCRNKSNGQNQNPILTVQEVVDRLKSIGINLDLATFLNETNSKRD